MKKKTKGLVEQADGEGGTAYRRFLKKQKRRIERRRAKVCPDTPPAYGKYNGYET